MKLIIFGAAGGVGRQLVQNRRWSGAMLSRAVRKICK